MPGLSAFIVPFLTRKIDTLRAIGSWAHPCPENDSGCRRISWLGEIHDFDTLAKRVYLGGEGSRFVELRPEGYNVFDHTQFTTQGTTTGGSGVTGDINDPNF